MRGKLKVKGNMALASKANLRLTSRFVDSMMRLPGTLTLPCRLLVWLFDLQ